MGALDRARIVQREINDQLYMLSLVGASEREYWNNRISKVITPDMPEYSDVKAGGEFISDGPTAGDAQRRGGSGPQHGDPGYDLPPTSAYDDSVPF